MMDLAAAAGSEPSASSKPDMEAGRAGGPLANANLDMLRELTDKKTTRDGQTAKRRGPKPDSKPALTRRQELNRQAQRTHRERKELYIKALEDEVTRLKEVFIKVTAEKEKLAEENKSLKAALQQRQGLSSQAGPAAPADSSYSTSASPGSVNASYDRPGISQATTTSTAIGGTLKRDSPAGGTQSGSLPQTAMDGASDPTFVAQSPLDLPQLNDQVNYEQVGTDFVLALEQPCMGHMPWLLANAEAHHGAVRTGHALMASFPPDLQGRTLEDIPMPVGRPVADDAEDIATTHTLSAAEMQNIIDFLPPDDLLTSTVPPNSSTVDPSDYTSEFQELDATALMAPTLAADVPIATGQGMPSEQHQHMREHRTLAAGQCDLTTLLDLSQQLNLGGEVTPIMAWGMVLAHQRVAELIPDDFAKLMGMLIEKVKCYGFGAVMEEYEVRDAIDAIFAVKTCQTQMGIGLRAGAPIAVRTA